MKQLNVLDRIEIEMEGKEDKAQDLYYFGFSKAPLLLNLSNCVFLCFTKVDAVGRPIATLVIKEKG